MREANALLQAVLDALPPPGQPITDERAYLREEAPGQFVVQGVGYLPIVWQMWDALKLCSFGDEGQYDYLSWRERFLEKAGADRFTPKMVAGMTRSDILYLLRTIQRGERFCDGSWTSAHGQGLFHAIIRRLLKLGTDGSKADPGSSPG